LILDMRNNSGGLLTQAVDMCDLFLDSGSIVITASKREKLNTQEAKESGDEPDYPIVVLSNEASASGAEIVIGALQKNNRAIVVGTRTFGKGSVQQLHQLRHDAQLKITVSEYLIPGKISIQENGVVPNIMALAVVDDGELDLFQNERSLTERNYERHIVSRYAKEESPDYTLRYLLDPVENDPYNDRFMSGELEPGKDKLVQIALSVLRLAGKPYRPGDILKEKRTEIEKLKDSLFADIEARLKEKGIDWSAGSSDAPTSIEPGELEMVLSREFIQEPSKEKDDPVPVNKVQVTARLSNKGNRTFYRMKGLSRSDYFLYKDRELLFGKLEPGQTLERSAKVRLPYFPFTRNDIFTVELSATGDLPQGDGQAANTVLLSAGIPIEIKDTGRPSFAYSAEILEEGGEGEAPKSISALREGLDAIFRVKIKNSGNAPAHKGVAILRNETGRQVFLNKGRIDFSNLAPKGETEVEFRFEVRSGEPLVEYDFELMVADSYSNAAISRKFTVPGTGKGLTKPFPNGVEFSAPTITALLVDPESREMVITTEKDTVNLEAMIQSQSPEHFKAWIFNSVVGNHELTADKIFFANSQGESQLKIATPVPLKKGINLFTVVSNGRDGLESRQNIVVRRE
ncbi:MAG TPA: S41 family peptidase, partial [Planctomycetota bacterium]|nr:S41 family peptidase [Planctomycetota bacterium]